jgi:hypothetical protein
MRIQDFARAREALVKHRSGEAAGLRVLPARVIAGEKCDAAVGTARFRAMRELRAALE